MNPEDIIRMAREVEIEPNSYQGWLGIEQLERFAILVAAAEREACAYRAGIALLGADRGLANRVDQAICARGQA